MCEHEHSGLPDLGAVGTDSRASSWAAAQPHSPHHGLSCPARLVWSPGTVSGHCSGGRGQAPPRRCPRSSACPPRGPLPTRTDLMAIWRLTSLPLTRLVLLSATSFWKETVLGQVRSGQASPAWGPPVYPEPHFLGQPGPGLGWHSTIPSASLASEASWGQDGGPVRPGKSFPGSTPALGSPPPAGQLCRLQGRHRSCPGPDCLPGSPGAPCPASDCSPPMRPRPDPGVAGLSASLLATYRSLMLPWRD